jgi:hypothetical protein
MQVFIILSNLHAKTNIIRYLESLQSYYFTNNKNNIKRGNMYINQHKILVIRLYFPLDAPDDGLI